MALQGIGTPEHPFYEGQVIDDLGNNSYYVSVKNMERGGEWAFSIDVPTGTDMSTSNSICDAIWKYGTTDAAIHYMAISASANTTLPSTTQWKLFDSEETENTGEL